MTTLEQMVTFGRRSGASDLHLEAGLPLGMRVSGRLSVTGEPLTGAAIQALVHQLLEDTELAQLEQQQSVDLARTVGGVRCRINVLRSLRGIGLVVRLLSAAQPTLKSLNLHPALRKLVETRHGLVIISGATGSGKSSTLTALVQELNLAEQLHIISVESPIEHLLTPVRSFIRQREVGRHTPSFEQALTDALREDPDVLMVGEVRDPETMRLTLNAAESGHLVLTSMHSASAPEALQRLVSYFPADAQAAASHQLADCLVGVVSQRLRWRPELKMPVPECELMLGTSAVKNIIRQSAFFKLPTALEGGGQEGSISLARYRDWMDAKTDWVLPAEPSSEPPAPAALEAPAPPPRRVVSSAPASRSSLPTARKPEPAPATTEDGVIVIDEDVGDPAQIMAQLSRRQK